MCQHRDVTGRAPQYRAVGCMSLTVISEGLLFRAEDGDLM